MLPLSATTRRPATVWLLIALSLAVASVPICAAGGLAHWLLVEPLPFRDSGELRYVFSTRLETRGSLLTVSLPDFEAWLKSGASTPLAAFSLARPMVVEGNPNEERNATFVSENLLDLAAVGLQAGSSDASDGEVLLSARLSAGRFGSARNAIGKSIRVDGQPLTVSGVLQSEFRGLLFGEVDIVLPLESSARFLPRAYLEDPETTWLVGLSRRDASSQSSDLVADVERACDHAKDLFADKNRGLGCTIQTPQAIYFGTNYRSLVWLLFLGAVLTALAALANFGGLLETELRSRAAEWSVRSALGATPARLAARLVVPSLVATLVGVTSGIVLGNRATFAMVSSSGWTPPSFSKGAVAPTELSLGAAAALAAAASLIAWLLAHRAARECSSPGTLRGSGLDGAPGKLRLFYVVASLALSAATLSLSLLAAQSLWILNNTSLGLPSSMTLFSLSLPARISSENLTPALDSVLEPLRSERMPLAAVGPAVAPEAARSTNISTLSTQTIEQAVPAFRHSISDQYAEASGLKYLAGGEPRQQSYAQTVGEAAVSAALANQLWPGEAAIGRSFSVSPALGSVQTWIVSGVLPDVLHRGAREPRTFDVYFPLSQVPEKKLFLLTQRSLEASLADSVRNSVARNIPDAVIGAPETLQSRIERLAASERLATRVASLVALIAFVLAATATYGIIAADAKARSREWVIRRSLGLTSSDVLRAILKKSVLLSGAAASLGILAATAVGRVLQDVLFGITSADPFTALVVLLLLAVTAAFAALAPALKAARTAPSQALKLD